MAFLSEAHMNLLRRSYAQECPQSDSEDFDNTFDEFHSNHRSPSGPEQFNAQNLVKMIHEQEIRSGIAPSPGSTPAGEANFISYESEQTSMILNDQFQNFLADGHCPPPRTPHLGPESALATSAGESAEVAGEHVDIQVLQKTF